MYIYIYERRNLFVTLTPNETISSAEFFRGLPPYFRISSAMQAICIFAQFMNSWTIHEKIHEYSWIHEFHFRGVFRTSSADLPRCWPNNNNSWRIHEFMNLTSAESSAHLPRIFRGAGQTTTSFLGRMNHYFPLPWTSPWIIHELLPLNSSAVFRPSSAVLPRCWQIDMFPSRAQIVVLVNSDSPYQGLISSVTCTSTIFEELVRTRQTLHDEVCHNT